MYSLLASSKSMIVVPVVVQKQKTKTGSTKYDKSDAGNMTKLFQNYKL